MEKYLSVIIGISALILGIVLFYFGGKQSKRSYSPALVIEWLLIALFPISMIFFFFPGNEATGTVLTFKFGGAFGAYVFLWWFGISRSIKAAAVEDLKKENDELKAQNQTLKNQQAAAGQNTKASIITNTERYLFSLSKDASRKIGLITGAIRNIKNVDVWVNSENTNMQMSRFYEASVSGIIRYMGAEKDNVGNVTKDTVAELLKQQLGSNLYVRPAMVLVTDPGRLAETNKVKKIFHVASVQGVEGKGYDPVSNLEDCIRNALAKADEMNGEIGSIVFPLLGTGVGKADLKTSAEKLIDTAIDYYRSTPESSLKEVYFIAYTDIQFNLLSDLLKNHPQLVTK